MTRYSQFRQQMMLLDLFEENRRMLRRESLNKIGRLEEMAANAVFDLSDSETAHLDPTALKLIELGYRFVRKPEAGWINLGGMEDVSNWKLYNLNDPAQVTTV